MRDGLNKNPKNIKEALQFLIDDMVTETKHVEDVNMSSYVAVSAVSGNTSNIEAPLVNHYLSKKITTAAGEYVIQTMRNEVMLAECVQDESSGAVLGKEVFRVTGQKRKSYTDADWPEGSGANVLIPVTSAKDTGVYKTGKLSIQRC